MNIDTMSVESLKALCYDELVRVEQSQKNIQVLNAEIQKRHATQPVEAPKEEK